MKRLFASLTLCAALLGGSAVLAAAPVSVPSASAQVQLAQGKDDKTKQVTDPVTRKKVEESSVVDYLEAIFIWASAIGGLLAVLMLIYAGYRYMGSYGDPEKISDAKDIIEKALIGLGLLILAVTLLNQINPRTTKPCSPAEIKAAQQGEKNGCGTIDFRKSESESQ